MRDGSNFTNFDPPPPPPPFLGEQYFCSKYGMILFFDWVHDLPDCMFHSFPVRTVRTAHTHAQREVRKFFIKIKQKKLDNGKNPTSFLQIYSKIKNFHLF